MIVTAEPYFAVTRPSNLVVAENIVRQDTAGGIHPISAKFDLLQKGQYTVNITARPVARHHGRQKDAAGVAGSTKCHRHCTGRRS